ncbi:hypothetical protein J8C06_00275 [Chloracidobacterium validum]|uniref:Uncharacterized protein n=1 Tax=Chloracidobacterium validum TaxID=2821543 RepID=A0ABX8BB99_9BACT|nr:hypothetical protein [Chloracidobacterium validum]QUW02923.1 hypothetical protein J8C06_00275 [Chloracidobacterium validum]
MVNPTTGKALNPNAQITLPTPDGKGRVTTVKQYFDELNALEQALAARGRSLRQPNAFEGLKPNFNVALYQPSPALPPNFKAISLSRYQANQKSATTIWQVPTTSLPNVSGGINTQTLAVANWQPNLYIGETGSDEGTVEFPVTWVKVSLASKGRKVFPLLLEVPKGVEALISKVEWQVSNKPFDETAINYKPKDVLRSGQESPLKWGTSVRGIAPLDYKGKVYEYFQVDLSTIEPEPVNQIKPYYIRVVCYGLDGAPMAQSNNALAAYGSVDKELNLVLTERNSVPTFQFAFPEGDKVPFSMFIRGNGLQSTRSWQQSKNKVTTLGYKVTANALLGLRYYNFLSIVNSSEPLSKELEVLRGDFSAILGTGTGLTGNNEPNGIRLKLIVLGIAADEIKFEPETPGAKTIALNYDIYQSLSWPLADVRFFIGPVPVRVTATLGGSVGFKLYGQANLVNNELSGTINPFLNTRFDASGGVDAVIAYVTLQSEVNPLVRNDMLMNFSAVNKPVLHFSNNLSGLKGRVYLKVGFYHPCPPVKQVKKLVGFITGGEEVPLCECAWEYNIFQFDGFDKTFQY